MDPARPLHTNTNRRRRRFTINRPIVLGIVLLILGIILLYWFDKRQGERAWEKYKAEAKARGVKLYLSEYDRPAIPDEENYAAAPIFSRLTSDASRRTADKALDIPHTRNVMTPSWLRPPDVPPFSPDLLALYQEAFVREKWIAAKSDSPAVDILTALERCEPALALIREASLRPKSQLPLPLVEPGTPWLYWGVPLLQASTDFLLRAQALLALQRRDEALAEMRHALRAARSLDDDAAGIARLHIQLAIWMRYLEVAEATVAANAWEDRHLEELAKDCFDLHVLDALVRGLNEERIHGNRMSEYFVTGDRSRLMSLLDGMGTGTPPGFDTFWSIMPRGWIRRDQVEYNRLLDCDIEDIDVNGGIISPQFSRSAKVIARYKSDRQQFPRFVTTLALRYIERFVFQAADAHTRSQQVRVECALVRYRKQHGEFPPSLETLVPAFLDRVPTDVMDGQPLRYRRTDTGGCLIWSIGQNRTDDDGKTDAKARRHGSPDWVSALPP